MRTSENALNVLTALEYRGIGKAWIVNRFPANEPASAIVACLRQHAKESHAISTEDFESRRDHIRSALEQLGASTDGVVAFGDPQFPVHRGDVPNGERPVALFYRGDFGLMGRTNKNIAVIGLLTPSRETEALERQVVSALVRRGATIVSGLALGCDSIAHSQAMQSGGKTVAILPGPLNDILPKGNTNLAEDIVRRGGLLISEYHTKAGSKNELSSRYVTRDRLQAMFSNCVVLSASYEKNDSGHDSGSRHAMEYARRYSIPRAAMYDAKVHADVPEFNLNRRLIVDSGAEVTVIGWDCGQATIDKLLSGPAFREVQGDLFS